MKLVASCDNNFDLPARLTARLFFDDKDDCKALVGQVEFFDVSPFRLEYKALNIKIGG